MKFTFRKKLFVSFFSLAAVLAFLVIGYIWLELAALPEEILNEMLLDAAGNAVMAVEAADVKAVGDLSEPTDTEAYRRLEAIMQRIAGNPPYLEPEKRPLGRGERDKHVFILVKTDKPGVARFAASLKPGDVGQTYDMSHRPAALAGWNGPAADQKIVAEARGRIMSGFAPIIDAKGQAVGLLVIEADARHVQAFDNMILVTAAIIFAAALVGSSVVALYISWRLNRPIRLLGAGMAKVARGEVGAYVQPMRTGDEFEALIGQFNTMVAGLGERDRMKESLAVAMEIQQHLLPQENPQLEGFDIAGKSLYCDETGGDYYDFIWLGDIGADKLGIAVGDITGHGIAAALLMASARGVLRSHAVRHGTDLDELFGAINLHLVRDTGDERFMTLFYGILDGVERTLTWTSGGHDPALWLRRQRGEIQELPNTGIPLGILEEARYTQGGPVTLDHGDIIVIGTDGIWETRNPAEEMFGKDRLRQILSTQADSPAAEIHAAIVEAVRIFQGTAPRDDDITLVVIKAT